VLYYLEELSYKEISDILKIPVATVGVRIKRAKEALKILIKDQVI
jgi:DNA-directed RNA polymerase specialized sigma24 family protein